ncbi:MAG: hypothetical protein HOI23_04490 [Deltaproteobacteria bacterium]|nr:hypothetical protein [Deltaproteobacteria bacterium]
MAKKSLIQRSPNPKTDPALQSTQDGKSAVRAPNPSGRGEHNGSMDAHI